METMNAIEERFYGELLRDRHPRVIRNEAENEEALRTLEELLAKGDAITAPESELAGLLNVLVERFEDEHYALSQASPKQILRELMDARDMRQKDLASIIGSKGVASEILSGKRDISKAQARKLAEAFSVSAMLFIEI